MYVMVSWWSCVVWVCKIPDWLLYKCFVSLMIVHILKCPINIFIITHVA